MQQLRRLSLDISVPPAALARRKGVTTVSGHIEIVRQFLEMRRKRETDEERRTSEITAEVREENAALVRISGDAATAATTETLSSSSSSSSSSRSSRSSSKDRRSDRKPSTEKRLSVSDLILLKNLDHSRKRHTGRFLTMHKRRRKRLLTRTLDQEPALLDDVFHGLAQCVLEKVGDWHFNAFTLETVTGGRSLPILCVHLFHWYGLLRNFGLDVVRVWKLFVLIEEGYHSTNPYHNSVHATDVTQAMHCFLQENKIRAHLSSLEIMASLIAAVTHDLDHPGVNQPFLVATSNHLAALYENTSVLENHHWRSAIACLLESGVSEQLPADVRPELQHQISSLILATDITRQQEFLARFKHYMDTDVLDTRRPEDRHFVLQIALKCADISNPCRPWDISTKWSYKVCEEFFRQGDYERQLGLPVTPLCDRGTTSIPKIQVGFFKFVVTPLYEEWHRFLGDGLSVSLMKHLRVNQSNWENMIVQEANGSSSASNSETQNKDSATIGSGEPVEIVIDEVEDSAELELQPETSIASITNSSEASRLSSVLQPVQRTKQLTRQQTFPPLQPYVRARYMSTTAEMVQCRFTETLMEAEDSSSNSNSSHCAGGRCGTPPSAHSRKETIDFSDKTISLSSDCARRISSPASQDSDIAQIFYASLTGQKEPRRYSTPVTDSTWKDDGRRFTAIPVPAEHGNRQVFFVGSPPDSPPRVNSLSSSSDSGSEPRRRRKNGRRRSIGDSHGGEPVIGRKDSSREKGWSKMPKLSLEERMMKENVDPRVIEDTTKGLSRRPVQGWARRRGSAPVTLLSRLDDLSSSTVTTRIDRHSRRGSAPTDITLQVNDGCQHRATLSLRGTNISSPRRASLPREAALSNLLGNVIVSLIGVGSSIGSNNSNNNNNENSSSHIINNNNNALSGNNNASTRITDGTVLSPRRGSVPADISELRRDLLGRNSGISRNRKKILKRRSSGGPEMFLAGNLDGNDAGAWIRWKKDLSRKEPDPIVNKRRGSLPIEMVAVAHPGGSGSTARRSSLWRL